MEIESKKQILERRKKIERELVEMLKETRSDFTLDHIRDTIYHEQGSDAMTEIMVMFDGSTSFITDRGGDASELSTVFELVTAAWNYFPHKVLGDISPAEKRLESQGSVNNLSQQDRDAMWGEQGPYSQVQLIFEHRILDGHLSRIFVIVSLNINPFTFELVKAHRKEFEHDAEVRGIIDHAQFQGQEDGYAIYAFMEEYRDEKVVKIAKRRLADSQAAIIRMHLFVRQHLDHGSGVRQYGL